MPVDALQGWLVGLVIAALPQDGAGVVFFAAGYPRAGLMSGTIEFRGGVLPNKGWRVAGNTVIVEAFINGGSVQEFEAPVKDNAFISRLQGSLRRKSM